MIPVPVFMDKSKGANKLFNKKCIITGRDSWIGRAIAFAFAKEGAEVAIIYLKQEERDAQDTAKAIEKNLKKKCLLIPADISREINCVSAIQKIKKEFKQIDVLVNNTANGGEIINGA